MTSHSPTNEPFEILSSSGQFSQILVTPRRLILDSTSTTINTGLEFCIPRDSVCLVSPYNSLRAPQTSWTVLPKHVYHQDQRVFYFPNQEVGLRLTILAFDHVPQVIEPDTPIARLSLVRLTPFLIFTANSDPDEPNDDPSDTERFADEPRVRRCQPVVLSPTPPQCRRRQITHL